jgi:hypothetical protein
VRCGGVRGRSGWVVVVVVVMVCVCVCGGGGVVVVVVVVLRRHKTICVGGDVRKKWQD